MLVVGTTSWGQLQNQPLSRAVQFGVLTGVLLFVHGTIEVLVLEEIWYAAAGFVVVVLLGLVFHQINRYATGGEPAWAPSSPASTG